VQTGNFIERWTRGLAAPFLGAKSQRQFSEQIKGRNFEVPGCGGFLLTSGAEDLESYYELDKEIVCFDRSDDLIEKIKYYLAHDDERAAIARRGYERTQRDHTYARRFDDIFRKIGLVNA
jgi:spore maturation protein CgeB